MDPAKVKAGTLPHHRPYDCPIDLQPRTEAPWGPIYNLSPTELEVLRAYIEENFANGFIHHSKSPAGAPISSKGKWNFWATSSPQRASPWIRLR